MDGALLLAANQALGEASAVALFTLAVAIMLWPLTKRLVEAHRQRVREESVAAGLAPEERK
jgi:hypothetical protein